MRGARRLDQGGTTRIDTASSAKSSLESSSHRTRQGTEANFQVCVFNELDSELSKNSLLKLVLLLIFDANGGNLLLAIHCEICCNTQSGRSDHVKL